MFEVRISPIHGRGLFATTFIPEGTILGELRVQPADLDQLDGPYVLWVDEDPVEVTCEMRYINHSDQPNAAYYDDLTVVTLHDILPGQEILHDYLGDGDEDEVEIGFDDELLAAI